MNIGLSDNKANYFNSFQINSEANFKVTYKKASQEDYSQVQRICVVAGLNIEIDSVEQPCKSPEINSQNFRIITKTGNKLLIRRCNRLKGLEKYNFLHEIFELLKKEGVRTPEFYLSEFSKIIYLETSEANQKNCWVFFKYIEAAQLYSGKNIMLKEAAEQIGKMHFGLKKSPLNSKEQIQSGPYFSTLEWGLYKKILSAKVELDEYDTCFIENTHLIEDAINFVEQNACCLKDPSDMQLIHFDLNSSNFIIDNRSQIHIMDFDELKVGNIYTDIAFALHRLITVCIEQGELNYKSMINDFLECYQKGNANIKIDLTKLKVAMYDRALRNIKTNLSLKYIDDNQDWLSSIPVNISRLKQVMALCSEL